MTEFHEVAPRRAPADRIVHTYVRMSSPSGSAVTRAADISALIRALRDGVIASGCYVLVADPDRGGKDG